MRQGMPTEEDRTLPINLPTTWRQATSILTQTPGLALLAIGTLALGIAAPTTMFSISSGILGDLPFESPEELVAIEKHKPEQHRWDIGIVTEDLELWRERTTSFKRLAGVDRQVFQVSDTTGAPGRYEGAAISPSGFSLIGVRPALGRTLVIDDALPGAAPVVVLGDQIWEERYGRDPAVLGRPLTINTVVHTIVGIMPEGFEFPRKEGLWIPLATYPVDGPDGFNVFARLDDRVSLQAAQTEMDALATSLAAGRPEIDDGIALTVQPYAEAARGGDAGMWMLSGMTLLLSLVLVIACVNVASLLLARAVDRNRELAVRMALGAGRFRIIRELLAESLVVASLGGVVGVILTHGAVAWFNADSRVRSISSGWSFRWTRPCCSSRHCWSSSPRCWPVCCRRCVPAASMSMPP